MEVSHTQEGRVGYTQITNKLDFHDHHIYGVNTPANSLLLACSSLCTAVNEAPSLQIIEFLLIRSQVFKSAAV